MAFWTMKWRRRSGPATSIASSVYQRNEEQLPKPTTQSILLLPAIQKPYELHKRQQVPNIRHESELLVKVTAIGLNPIDWKAPDFDFGIPILPYISGREFVGTVVETSTFPDVRVRKGDIVIVASTDYRDLRKAAFQEYAIASSFNSIRLPKSVPTESGAILGVAFVAAALTLGICMGVSFKSVEDGPDLLEIVRGIEPERLPVDIREECLNGINEGERARPGDFLVIWGGGSTCAHVLKQLSRLVGLKLVSVVDASKHGLRVSSHENIRPDLLVDSHDPERAINIIRSATNDSARFGFDTEGKVTAGHLLRSLASPAALPPNLANYNAPRSDKLPTPPSTPQESHGRAHLIGLTGLPKANSQGYAAFHSVPIKLFHEIPEVGEALCNWCEILLVKGFLVPPDVVGTVTGLEGINGGLDRLRKREVRGGRLVSVLR